MTTHDKEMRERLNMTNKCSICKYGCMIVGSSCPCECHTTPTEDTMDQSIQRYKEAKENGTLDRDFPVIGSLASIPLNSTEDVQHCPKCYAGDSAVEMCTKRDCECHSFSQEVGWEDSFRDIYYNPWGSHPADKCALMLSFIRNLLSQSSTKLLSELIEETEGKQKPDLDLSPGFNITAEFRLGEIRGYNQALSDIQTLLKKKLNQK